MLHSHCCAKQRCVRAKIREGLVVNVIEFEREIDKVLRGKEMAVMLGAEMIGDPLCIGPFIAIDIIKTHHEGYDFLEATFLSRAATREVSTSPVRKQPMGSLNKA